MITEKENSNSEVLPAETSFDSLFKNFWSGSTYKNVGRLPLSEIPSRERAKIEEEILKARETFDGAVIFFKIIRPLERPILQLYVQKNI